MLQDSPAAHQFIDKLIEQKALQDLDEDILKQLHQDLLHRLEARIVKNIIDSLNTKQLAEFEHLIDTKQVDKIQDFLYKQGVNIHEVLARSMSEFQQLYLET